MTAVALTLGDPAGIGGEISLMAWRELAGDVPFFLVGCQTHMAGVSRALNIPVCPIISPHEASDALRDGLPVLDHPLAAPATAGIPVAQNAPHIVEMIDRAVEMARCGDALAICTNPINKKVLQTDAGFLFPGHTEYLAHLSDADLPVMMLASPLLRVVPVTIHIPLSGVPAALTPELLEKTLRVTHSGLISDFGISDPRIAVAGLNPHAGERGAMGHEDDLLIAPVVERLSNEGINLTGPHSADTLFHARARKNYDAAVCMYHDQALIPIKTLDFDGGVNVTLGLDFVRTSPDHGTAYNIAGTGTANPSSLVAALRMSADLGARRKTMK